MNTVIYSPCYTEQAASAKPLDGGTNMLYVHVSVVTDHRLGYA
jgi:hypothetical protein